MQLSVMRSEARLIFGESDINNSHVTELQLNQWGNQAYRLILTKIQAIPKKERDYTSAAEITLSDRTLFIDSAFLKEQPQDKFQNLTVIPLDLLRSIDPQWPSAEKDIPRYFIRKDTFTALLWPPPNAEQTGQTVRTFGLEFPPDLSLDTDTPKLPLNLHDVFQNYMAHKFFLSQNMPERAQRQLNFFNATVRTQKNVSAKFSDQIMQWKYTGDI